VASDEASGKNEMTRSFHHRGHRGHRDGEKRERGSTREKKNPTQRRGAHRDYAEKRFAVWCDRYPERLGTGGA